MPQQKKIKKEKPKKKTVKKTVNKKYYQAVGRRKESTARVRLFTARPNKSASQGGFIVNGKSHKEFFSTINLIKTAESPLEKLKSLNRFKVEVKVKGGGITGQAEATRLGLARSLVKFDSNFKKKLKKAGYLTRDSRKKERKKFGLRKARRAPQWKKR